MSKASSSAADVSVLLAADDEAYAALDRILRPFQWRTRHVKTCAEAIAILRGEPQDVVVCEAQLPDGHWTAFLDAFLEMLVPPKLIVTWRLADESLWAEVLNLGGHDVLAQPFEPEEVFRVLCLAANTNYGSPDQPE